MVRGKFFSVANFRVDGFGCEWFRRNPKNNRCRVTKLHLKKEAGGWGWGAYVSRHHVDPAGSLGNASGWVLQPQTWECMQQG